MIGGDVLISDIFGIPYSLRNLVDIALKLMLIF